MKILVVRFSSIGDIVLTTPVIRVLAKHGHEVHFLTKKAYAEVLEGNPYLTKVHYLAEEWSSLIDKLKEETFDHLVDLHRNMRTARLKFQLGVNASSFPKINRQKWLAVHFHKKYLPSLHIVERYFEALRPLSLENDNEGLDFFFSEEFSFSVEAYLARKRIEPQKNYLGWVLGGAHKTKCFPEDKIEKVLALLQENVVLIGGPEEKELGQRLQEKFNGVINSCGDLSIAESAKIVQSASTILTNDTGMMHIAAAFLKPMVVFWGNTIPEFGMYPYMPQTGAQYVNLEVHGLNCRPCSKIGFAKCPKKHFRCMRDLRISDVITSLKSLEV